MGIGQWFWLFFVLFALGGGWFGFNRADNRPIYFGGYGFILILILLIGIGVFGWPIHG